MHRDVYHIGKALARSHFPDTGIGVQGVDIGQINGASQGVLIVVAPDAVARALDESHIHVTSNRSYNNEDALGSAIYLAYIYALNSYTCVREMTAGKGFADVVYIPVHPGDPEKPAMIMELKKKGSAQGALDQIREKKYFDSLEHYQGRLLFVGIEYDEKDKTHTAKLEWFEK